MSDHLAAVFCPHCHKEVERWLPVEPLYSLDDAMFCLLIPSRAALYTALWRHKERLGPPQYAYDRGGRRHRLLTLNDILVLKRHTRRSLRGAMRWLKLHQREM